MESFITEYERILAQLPDKNVFITGDFNINLHTADRDTSNFELTFLSAGYTPTISLVTHEQPHCNGTCIDNIFANSYHNVILSGTISDKVTNHLPIYCITHIDVNNPIHENNKDTGPYYDYSNYNMDAFLKILPRELENHSSSLDFNQFTDILKATINKTCISDLQNKSKRNYHTNPWITQGIIGPVKNKHFLYKT